MKIGGHCIENLKAQPTVNLLNALDTVLLHDDWFSFKIDPWHSIMMLLHGSTTQ
jgi:hypothetical protein